MKRIFALAPIFAVATSAVAQDGIADAPITIPAIQREFRGMFVATVSNIDWPSTKGTTQSVQNSQKAEALAILQTATDLKLNAILLQVRPQCDALYPSTIEPWSPFLSNTMGSGPSPAWDPLQYWIDQCRLRNLELHVWLNPYRALATATSAVSSNHITVTNPGIVRTYDNKKILDPGEPGTVTYVRSVINDLVTRYDIDGLVFDDYFYPYPVSGVDFPDTTSYAAYTGAGGTLTKPFWRRKNVDDFVQGTYSQIHNLKSWVKFGISPFGIWKPGNPAGVTGLSAYDDIYADSRKWLQNGWVDYMAPQLYWKISSSGQPYGSLMAWWANSTQNPLGRQVFASNNTSNIVSLSWPYSEIQNQIDVTRTTSGATGNIHFSAKALVNNYGTAPGIKPSLQSSQYASYALVPRAAWLDNGAPLKPTMTYTQTIQHQISWSSLVPTDVRSYVLSTLIGTTWTHEVLTGTTVSKNIPLKNSGLALRAFGVAAVDRLGNISSYATRVLDPSVLATGVRQDGGSRGPIRTLDPR